MTLFWHEFVIDQRPVTDVQENAYSFFGGGAEHPILFILLCYVGGEAEHDFFVFFSYTKSKESRDGRNSSRNRGNFDN